MANSMSMIEYMAKGLVPLPGGDGTGFPKKLQEYKADVSSTYAETKQDPNMLIAEIADADNLNDEQIKRLCEAVNNQIYLILYNRKRSENVREVDFELAHLDKVKSFSKQEKVASYSPQTELSRIEKMAHEMELASKVVKEEPKLSPELQRELISRNAEILIKTSADEYAGLIENAERRCVELNHHSSVIGESLAKYASLGFNPQEVFEKIAIDANENTKDLIVSNYNKSCEMYKKAFVVVDTPVLSKNLENKYSLGKYSLDKTASHMGLPTILIAGKSIDGVPALMDEIEKIASLELNLIDNFSRQIEIEKECGLPRAELEKLSAFKDSGMLNGYINVLKGIPIEKAKKDIIDNNSKIREAVKDPSMKFYYDKVSEAASKGPRHLKREQASSFGNVVKERSGYKAATDGLKSAQKDLQAAKNLRDVAVVGTGAAVLGAGMLGGKMYNDSKKRKQREEAIRDYSYGYN